MNTNAAINALIHSQWLWIGLTVLFFQFGVLLYKASGKISLFQPVLIGLVLVVLCLELLGASYQHYAATTQPLILLLGLVTVALAVPLYRNLKLMGQAAGGLTLALLCGGAVTTAIAVAIAHFAGSPSQVVWSLSVKTITGPFAMLVSETLGGYAALAALIVLITGIITVVITPPILKLLKINDERILGFTLGTMGHGIGTAAAFEVSSRCGAFAALGMSLMGVTIAVTLPIIASFL